MKTPYRFRTSRDRRAEGFSLVELLVAEAIFLILLVVVVQLIFGLIQTSATQKKRMDSLDDARQALDRLSLDWAARVRRPDAGGLFIKNATGGTTGGNDQVAFAVQAQSYANSTGLPTRHLAWVTYGVSPVSQVVGGSQSSLTSALVRGTQGYNYSESGFPLFTLPATTNTSTGATTSAAPSSLTSLTTEPLANTVFRFEYCFLVQVPAGSATGTSYTVGSPANPIDLTSSNLVGLVVAVAALDPGSRQILTQTQLNALSNALPDATTADPQSTWVTQIDNGTFAASATAAGVPLPVANAVRIFQRVLYVEQ